MVAKSTLRSPPSILNRSWLLVVLLSALTAFALRTPFLDRRPLHNDEAVNAVKFGRLWQEGAYKYDPNEHHGPTLYYASLAVGRLTAAPDFAHYSDARLRLVTVLFGVGLVLLIPLLFDGLGHRACCWAALFAAVSPAFVFYSRYYIHEILLVFFTLLALGAGWRYWRTRKLHWMILAAGGLGLMDATKETFVLSLVAASFAVVLNVVWNRVFDASPAPPKRVCLNPRHWMAGGVVWLVVAGIFFTSFFTNAAGPLDSIRSYLPWIGRAGGTTPHVHPWHFFLHRLLFFHIASGPVWTEAPILVLAFVGSIFGFRRTNLADGHAGCVRFLAFYSFILTALYSQLAYKTPWCLLNFWLGMILLAGVGAAVLANISKSPLVKMGIGAAILASVGHLGWQSWISSTTYATDRRNPYVYSQTLPDLFRLVNRVEELGAADPAADAMVVKVIAPEDDYWPLPYYLRRFQHIGWWSELPADPYAPVMIVSAQLHAALDERKTHLMVGYFELRPQVFLELYVEKNLWLAWLSKHPPDRTE